MRWYLNDASLQGQFTARDSFAAVVRDLIAARAHFPIIRQNLRSTRSLQNAMVDPETDVRRALYELRDKDLRAATLSWLDRTGPFVDDDRLPEIDDYFEYRNIDVTATGLGEAARRTKAGTECATYSFIGGVTDFAINPLEVDHGLSAERYGRYHIPNLWQIDALLEQALTARVPINSWRSLIDYARQRFPRPCGRFGEG